MTKKQAEAALARCEAATTGPWETTETVCANENYACGSGPWHLRTKDVFDECKQAISDAQFISHARTDLPMALAEIKRLQKNEERLISVLKRFVDSDNCGDHCPNSCIHCQGRAAIAAAVIREEKTER